MKICQKCGSQVKYDESSSLNAEVKTSRKNTSEDIVHKIIITKEYFFK